MYPKFIRSSYRLTHRRFHRCPTTTLLIQMHSVNRLRISRRETITASILGVVGGLIASFAERADAIVTGGNATPLGFVNTYTWLLVSACLFGPTGAIITTEVQAFLGLVTAANPLSWLWPIINFVFALVIGFLSIGVAKLRPTMKIRTRLILLSGACAILDVPLTYLVIVMVLGLPFIFFLIALPIYMALQIVPSTIISYILLRAILRSGLVG